MNKEKSNADQLIMVRGRPEMKVVRFPISNWRKAFNTYLDTVWSQNNNHSEGLLGIGEILLSLDKGEYWIQYPYEQPRRVRPMLNRDQIHALHVDRNNFELGLAKFVRSNYMRQLVLEFPCDRLMFWKGKERTELNYCICDRTF